MNLSEKVPPFLTARQKAEGRLDSWLTVLQAKFDERYGAKITPALEPIFASYAADAIVRRIDRPNRLVRSQSVGPAAVTYDPRAPLGGWFLQEEIDDMDQHAGLGGGVRSVRMAAPDAVRYGNVARTIEDIIEGA
jgi:hypothetical protein